MFSKMWKELQNKRKENKGAALVMVIIAIAFIGMLVGMVLYMAYCNYLMKSSDTLAKDNFYSAEYALDVINAGLQMDVSESMSEAYVIAMKDSVGSSSEDMELDFQEKFVENMQEKLWVSAPAAGESAKWDADYLKEYWTKANMPVAATGGAQGAYLGIKGGNDKNLLVVADGNAHITLNNLEIIYTDDRGFVSIITTDIRVKVPSIGFAQAATKMSIENFSLIANNALINDTHNTDPAPGSASLTKGSDVKVSGNVFGGYDGVYIDGSRSISFVKDAADASYTPTYNLIANDIHVNSGRDRGVDGLLIEDVYDTYVSNINITTAKADLSGEFFVGDDLDVSGTGSVLKLSGIYRGYGNNVNSSDGSSSILINGGNTTLDFGRLDELTLSGHAYVGAKRYDADVDRLAYGADIEDKNTITGDEIPDFEEYEDRIYDDQSPFVPSTTTIPQNQTDFLMGESISVKANQLLYMVPAECIAFNLETEAQEASYAKNPMTYAEYELLTKKYPVYNEDGTAVMENGQQKTEVKYDLVRLTNLWNKLGGIAYTTNYKTVFRRVNGTVLVYLYLDFGNSDVMANEFFKAYYEYDKEGIDNYVASYIRSMTWNATLTQNLTLAGNGFYLNRNDEVVFVENDLQDPNKYGNMLVKQVEYSNTYTALMHTLSTDYDAMTGSQQNSDIFATLVEESNFAKMSGLKFNNGVPETDAARIDARIKDGDIVYPSSECPTTTKLIVASGNIFLNEDFKGLAMAGGNIYVCSGCEVVNYSPSDVMQAMRTTATPLGGETMYAYDIFGASGSLTYGNSGTADEEKIDLSDLILYQNWKKE